MKMLVTFLNMQKSMKLNFFMEFLVMHMGFININMHSQMTHQQIGIQIVLQM